MSDSFFYIMRLHHTLREIGNINRTATESTGYKRDFMVETPLLNTNDEHDVSELLNLDKKQILL